MDTPVKYIATITNVPEVSLAGTADLEYWRELLAKEGLSPVQSEGRAQLLIGAIASRYLGLKFRELTVAVLVREREPVGGREGVYLAHAFNSSRLFALLERTCFSTPYYHGDIHVNANLPASLHLVKGAEVVFRAEMSADAVGSGRVPLRSGDDCWEGAIFLPGGKRGENAPRKVFFARLSGYTRSYPFSSGDRVTFAPSFSEPVLRWLVDSGFSGKEWAVRENATHSRSKTFRRNRGSVS